MGHREYFRFCAGSLAVNLKSAKVLKCSFPSKVDSKPSHES